MAQKVLALREYATNILQRNVIKAMYNSVYSYTKNEHSRVYAEFLECECKSILNYDFGIEKDIIGLPFIKIYSKFRKNDKPIYELVKTEHINDMEHLYIITPLHI